MRMQSWKLWAAALLCSGAVAFTTQSAWAVHDADLFELDGNAQDNPAVLGDDWSRLNPPNNLPGTAPNFITKDFLAEGIGVTIFTTGGSKDDKTIQNTGMGNNGYKHKSGSVPDKDEILNAYAAAYNCPVGATNCTPDDLMIYFGADRYANDGDALLGFWFFQQNVAPIAGGVFTGEKTEGDIFVLSNFTGGGQVIGIQVYRWVPGGGPGGGGPDNLVLLGTFGDCIGGPAADPVCATSNQNDTPSPWPYTPKQGVAGTFPIASFFEGGLNLTALLLDAGITDLPCFTSYMAETRSSSSVDATLKDFVAGTFDICGVTVTKVCNLKGDGVSDDFTMFEYELSGTATSKFGTLYDGEVIEDLNMNGQIDAGEPVIATLASISSGAGTAWGPVDLITSTNGPSDKVIVRAATQPGGAKTVISDVSNLATCPTVTKTPNISVTKECRACLAIDSSMVKVTVLATGQVCNTSDVPLINVTVTDDLGTADTADDVTHNIGSLSPAGAADNSDCATYNTGPYYPASVNSEDPEQAVFQDHVSAAGTTTLFGDVSAGPVQATCELCVGTYTGNITCPALPGTPAP